MPNAASVALSSSRRLRPEPCRSSAYSASAARSRTRPLRASDSANASSTRRTVVASVHTTLRLVMSEGIFTRKTYRSASARVARGLDRSNLRERRCILGRSPGVPSDAPTTMGGPLHCPNADPAMDRMHLLCTSISHHRQDDTFFLSRRSSKQNSHDSLNQAPLRSTCRNSWPAACSASRVRGVPGPLYHEEEEGSDDAIMADTDRVSPRPDDAAGGDDDERSVVRDEGDEADGPRRRELTDVTRARRELVDRSRRVDPTLEPPSPPPPPPAAAAAPPPRFSFASLT
mmetsp:Transcript_13938/g.43889  ORF Transcript_13938/g.43889 Transcript_13938/m.43889 type:complete len:287 (-) Transcript_13938:295-1155(-)